MRILLLLFLVLFSLQASSQINRSATELAKENVKEYIISKIFRDLPYKPFSFGELKAQQEPQPDITWSMSHRFEIIDSQFKNDKRVPVARQYYFSFYLDKKLKVVTAESYYRE